MPGAVAGGGAPASTLRRRVRIRGMTIHTDRVMTAIRRWSIIGLRWSPHDKRTQRWKPASLMCLDWSTPSSSSSPADKANFSREMAAELRSLVDREVVRVLDLLRLSKGADGSVEAIELKDAPEAMWASCCRSKPMWRCCW